MGGSPKGGPQSRHLMPPIRDTDDPRYQNLKKGREKYWARQKAAKERRIRYEQQLAEIKTEQLEIAQSHIESGTVPAPAEMLMTMIKEQQLIVADESLSDNAKRAERTLLMQMWDRYDKLLGASAPNSQSIDVTTTTEEEKTPEEIQETLLKKTAALREVK